MNDPAGADSGELELIGGREKRAVVIRNYDDSWPVIFRKHASIITGALGGTALRIEHIGSTSVPGLSAKPIVDILLVVENSGDESSYLPVLHAAGYELRVREPNFDEHRMFRTPERDVHIHVFSPDSQEIDRYLLFRDRLRLEADERARYERLKRELAQREWGDINDYADAKSELVEEIILLARKSPNTTD